MYTVVFGHDLAKVERFSRGKLVGVGPSEQGVVVRLISIKILIAAFKILHRPETQV